MLFNDKKRNELVSTIQQFPNPTKFNSSTSMDEIPDLLSASQPEKVRIGAAELLLGGKAQLYTLGKR